MFVYYKMVKTHQTRKNCIKVYIKDRITETTCVEDEYSVLLPPEMWQLLLQGVQHQQLLQHFSLAGLPASNDETLVSNEQNVKLPENTGHKQIAPFNLHLSNK